MTDHTRPRSCDPIREALAPFAPPPVTLGLIPPDDPAAHARQRALADVLEDLRALLAGQELRARVFSDSYLSDHARAAVMLYSAAIAAVEEFEVTP